MTLDEAKELVSSRFLGVSGIHGVGLRRRQRAVSLYVESEDEAALEATLSSVRQAIEPFGIVVVRSDRPRQMPGTGR